MGGTLADGQFIGTVRGMRQVGALTLAETSYAAGQCVPAHAHETPLFCFVLHGALTERCGCGARLCERGSLIFHPADEAHSHVFHGAGTRCFNVQLGAPWIARLDDYGVGRLGEPRTVDRARVNWLAEQLYAEFCQADTASALAIDGYALAMIGEIARLAHPARRGSPPSWLRRAVDLLHAGFAGPLDMAEIARAVDIHPVQLARVFRRHYGCTMGEYVRRLRVEAARHELVASDKPLSAIAHAAGFADQGHFSRTFKALTGTTPGAYRRQAGER